MKSLNKFIGEAKKNTVTFEYDNSPKWIRMTCGVDYSGEPVIIIGEPCSRTRQDAWEWAYGFAKPIGGTKFREKVDKNILVNFDNIADDLGEELDERQCLCICYLPNHDEWAVYVYGSDGVMAIK